MREEASAHAARLVVPHPQAVLPVRREVDMIGATVAIIGLVSGGIGGVVASAFMEAYFGRRAQDEVGDYDPVSS